MDIKTDTIAAEIRGIRAVLKLTQKQLASKFDPPVTSQTVLNWEGGKGMPDAAQIDIIRGLVK